MKKVLAIAAGGAAIYVLSAGTLLLLTIHFLGHKSDYAWDEWLDQLLEDEDTDWRVI